MVGGMCCSHNILAFTASLLIAFAAPTGAQEILQELQVLHIDFDDVAPPAEDVANPAGAVAPPDYFGEPFVQDLRYILSFAFGFMVMRILDLKMGDAPCDEEQGDSSRKFELYPFAI